MDCIAVCSVMRWSISFVGINRSVYSNEVKNIYSLCDNGKSFMRPLCRLNKLSLILSNEYNIQEKVYEKNYVLLQKCLHDYNGIWYVIIINDVSRRMSCVIAIIYLFKLLLHILIFIKILLSWRTL